MQKSLKNRITNFIKNATYKNTGGMINGTIYYTDNPINDDDSNYGYKYFFYYHHTNNIIAKFRNQNLLSDWLTDLAF